MSVNAVAIPAALEPGALVTRWRNRTVANVDPDRVGGAQVHPVLGGVVVAREEHVEVVGDSRGRLGQLRLVHLDD